MAILPWFQGVNTISFRLFISHLFCLICIFPSEVFSQQGGRLRSVQITRTKENGSLGVSDGETAMLPLAAAAVAAVASAGREYHSKSNKVVGSKTLDIITRKLRDSRMVGGGGAVATRERYRARSEIETEPLDEDFGFWQREAVISGRQPPRPTPKPTSRPTPSRPTNGGGGGPTRPTTTTVRPSQPSTEQRKPYYTSNLSDETCSTKIIDSLLQITSVIVTTPTLCCGYDGPTAVYVTHSQPFSGTEEQAERRNSGFEEFWNEVHNIIASYSDGNGICYVMTGYDPSKLDSNPSVSDGERLANLLVRVLDTVSSTETVSVIMGTAPEDNDNLLDSIRGIWNDPMKPFIGIFNSGFLYLEEQAEAEEKTELELLPPRIPYAGYLSDAEFGIVGADVVKELLAGVPPVPLCLNHRTDLPFVGDRCASFYDNLGAQNANPKTGVQCTGESTSDDIYALINQNTNAIFVQGDCTDAAASAVRRIKDEDRERIIFIGAADSTDQHDSLFTLKLIDFIIAQPILGQAFTAASWASLPVYIDANLGFDPPYNLKEGRANFFPSLGSVAHTAIYHEENLDVPAQQ